MSAYIVKHNGENYMVLDTITTAGHKAHFVTADKEQKFKLLDPEDCTFVAFAKMPVIMDVQQRPVNPPAQGKAQSPLVRV